ncbi:sulfotransferase family 2 domain-containing protein [Paracoccus nototheniae]|uniref:sulfotransferase family 2 domain-containing protein n=1 Tax=Paracoccus nototheniae TaxID=2489002 RepID=UPI00103BE50F|nr:sulfotransferase family 2 domain-containing protein [Paracoccus nototheniae]
MAFNDLARMSLSRFIETHRGDDRTLWLFQHIPKTAGSSFSTELRTRNRPYRNICVDYADASMSHEDKIAQSVTTFLQMAQDQPFRSASGHLKLPQIRRVAEASADCRVITFLRQPEARVISDYRYQRTPMHPPHQDFIRAFPTLESYVRSSESQNKMADFLLGGTEGVSAAEAAAQVGESHLFLGLLEQYPMSFNIVFRLMGHDGLWPSEHKRKTPETEATKVDISQDLRRMIRRTNPLDIAIYAYVHRMLAPHRQAFRQLSRPQHAGKTAESLNGSVLSHGNS